MDTKNVILQTKYFISVQMWIFSNGYPHRENKCLLLSQQYFKYNLQFRFET